jgi:N-methylhydantoinase A
VVGKQRAHFPPLGEVALPRYDRAALAPGLTIAGPALVEDEWSTIVVGPGQRCAADRLGNLVIEVTA